MTPSGVYFHGFVEGPGHDVSNDGGIWGRAGGSLTAIVREGPGGTDTSLPDGAYFVSSQVAGLGQFYAPTLNANGHYMVSGRVGGPGRGLYNNDGIWTNLDGTLQPLFLEGTDGPMGPNLGAGVHFWASPTVLLNDTGEAVVRGVLTGLNISNDNDRAIWKLSSGQMTLIAREGPQGPGPFPRYQFTNLPIPSFNNHGQLAFLGYFNGPGIHSANDSGIFTTTDGTLTRVVLEGTDSSVGPNLGPGVKFGNISNPTLNDAGTMLFDANLAGLNGAQGTGQGFWTRSAGQISALVLNETDGPLGPGLGPGVHFDRFYTPQLNHNDVVAFNAKLTGTGIDTTNEWGIWKKTGNELELLAREGPTGHGPDVGAGVFFKSMKAPLLNATGEVAFVGYLTGAGVGNDNNSGLWATSGGKLTNILREGDPFDVDPSAIVDLRVISTITFPADGTGDHIDLRLAFSDTGLMTIRLGFTDGTQGIFTAQIPEPVSLAYLLACVSGVVIRPRRQI